MWQESANATKVVIPNTMLSGPCEESPSYSNARCINQRPLPSDA